MIARGGDHRSRLLTIQQTSAVLPTTLAVTNNDRHRSEMNFNSRSVGVCLERPISVIGFSEILSFYLYR
ncbi:hypothetical protein [Geomicrobium sp. JCM 19039]|uniref:hypothetical protein n=1 Tax=Geomicrobium sp. JCM 19039 TaxID=1460636 RepID=UPI0012680285|nr:hypothetical protein [Geomicrobium sp. JCM 19039]